MREFVMPERNTCYQCGAELLEKSPVYADNYDQVRCGMGKCVDCTNPPSASGNAESPVKVERDDGEGRHDTPDPKSTGNPSKPVKVKARRKAS
jgi:hypothetical protein